MGLSVSSPLVRLVTGSPSALDTDLLVVPAVGGIADDLSGIQLVTSVDGIKPGLGT